MCNIAKEKTKVLQSMYGTVRNKLAEQEKTAMEKAFEHPWTLIKFKFVVYIGDGDYDEIHHYDQVAHLSVCLLSDGNFIVYRYYDDDIDDPSTESNILSMSRELHELAARGNAR